MAKPRMAVTSWAGTDCWPTVENWGKGEDEDELRVNAPRRRKMVEGLSLESLHQVR